MSIEWDSPGLVFLRSELLEQGFDDRAIRRMVAGGEWHRIRRGAYCLGELWRCADAVARHRLTCRAVLMTAHPSAVLTHVSSLVEREVPTYAVDLTQIHTTRTDGKSGRREAGVVHHRGRLNEWEVEIVNGLRISRASRSIVELTSISDVPSGLVSANWLLAHGACSKDELMAVARRCAHWPNTLATELTTKLADGRCGWPGEARFAHLAWRHHLDPPVPQCEVYDDAGNLVAVVDFAWPELGVFLEFDGAVKYERLRKPGESLEDVILREKRREERICLVTGWVCIRITWADLAQPEKTARRIQRLLDSRRRLAL